MATIMPYPTKKPFGKAPFNSVQGKHGKPFKKFSKFTRSSLAASGAAKGGQAGGPAIRTATKIGEHAPKPLGSKPKWADKPAWKSYNSKPAFKPFGSAQGKPTIKKDFSSKWARPYTASGGRATSGSKPEKKFETSWGGVAQWYHDTVEEKGSYQKDLILPNLLRLMDIHAGETVLDLACGEGFFSRRFNRLGAKVFASDISKELIEIAKKDKDVQGVQFDVSSADAIPFIKDSSIDKAVIVLALQNIENVPGVFAECSRVLKQNGKLYFVINHPAFRIPKQSSWGWDEVANRGAYSANRENGETIQYRRVDRYLSELREKIDMRPSLGRHESASSQPKSASTTISFHRPLQYFAKSLKKNGFAITGMEEWSSDRKSEPGPRAEAENRARIEIPMFMFIEARKISSS
ncbi:MAG: class I SAM-dependent methyltransferase [bacterium]|nr:class I SAM-dependent methyltransferase [bacterium]